MIKYAPIQASKNQRLTQQKVAFTSEDSPIPGRVALSTPATVESGAGAEAPKTPPSAPNKPPNPGKKGR